MIGQQTFSALGPVLHPQQQKLGMSPSSTVHGGQHDTKYVTFELSLHAAFVADEIWGFMLKPARVALSGAKRYSCIPILMLCIVC